MLLISPLSILMLHGALQTYRPFNRESQTWKQLSRTLAAAADPMPDEYYERAPKRSNLKGKATGEYCGETHQKLDNFIS